MANPEDITVDDDATEIANKAIIARYVYATNIMDLDSFDGYVAEDYVEHEPIPGQKPGREGLKEAYKIFAGPFSDAVFVFVDLFCEGDLVFGRGEISGTNDGEFFGIPPTNKKVSWTGTRLFRLKDNRVTDGWFNADVAGMLVQLGGAPGTREQNKEIMRTLIDRIWANGEVDLADDLFHPAAICPSAATLPVGPEGTKMIVQMVRSAFPDYWVNIDLIAAEDDRVGARITQGGTHGGEFFGIPPTGKEVQWTEMAILRIGDGKILATWFDSDIAGLMQQL